MTETPTTTTGISDTVISCLKAEVPAVPADVDHDAELAAYGLNSMKVVEVLFGLEDAFEITIDEDDVADDTFKSVNSIVDFLAQEKNVAD